MRKGHILVCLLAMLLLPVAAHAQVGGPGTVVVGGGSSATGTIGGSTGATDDALLCADGVGGSTLGVCTIANIDNLRADGNTISTTNVNGDLLLNPNGIGKVKVGQGRALVLDYFGNASVGFNSGGTLYSTDSSGFTQYQILADHNSWMRLGSGKTINWNSAVNVDSGALDTGLARSAAGVVKCTDGSTGVRCLLGGGAAIASATALPVPTGGVFHVTGTTTITSITSTNFQSGVCATLIFDDALTFTDGSNLKLAGDFVTTADDTISLCYDGTNWHETSRSVN